MRPFLFTLFLLSFFFSCQKETPQGVHAQLYVRYDGDIKELKAEASFFEMENGKVKGSKIFQKGVQFINSGMRTVELPNGHTRYNADISGPLPRSTSFTWSGQAGQPVTANAKITRVNGVEILENKLSLSSGFSISLNTTVLGKSEKIILSVIDANQKGKSLEIVGPTKDTKFQVPASALEGMAKGGAFLTVIRSGTEQLTLENFTATLTSEFYAAPKKVEITD